MQPIGFPLATLLSTPDTYNPAAPNAVILNTIVQNVLGKIWGTIDENLIDHFVHQLEWTQLNSGECLYEQHEQGDCMHIIISGRLKVIKQTDQGRITLGEISSGECVGEMSLLSDAPRSASIYAIRNSVVVKITKEQFETLCIDQPQLLRQISKTVIQRLTNKDRLRKKPAQVKNIALLPVSKDIDMDAFLQNIQQSLQKYGKVLLLNEANINDHLKEIGITDFTKKPSDDIKFNRWLEKKEQETDFILYQGNYSNDYWTQASIRQADKIILVSDFYDYEKTEVEKQLLDGTKKLSYVSKSLVLLHPNGDKPPKGTARHLDIRAVDRHHHVRWNQPADFQRLARFMIGKAVGLVLGGGGAKGFAHIGVIKRMKEAGIPIDFVGGTSIGAIIAAGVAMDMDPAAIHEQARTAFVIEKPLTDVTIPLVSYYSGQKLNKMLRKNLGEGTIEDQWVNFFCVSSNLSKACANIHRRGSFWQSVRASLSIPGALPPVVFDGDLMVDGALMNNLPIDIMADMGVGKIIGVDLSEEKKHELNYEEMPTSFQLLKNKFSFRKKRLKVPSLMTIISKSIVLASYEKANAVGGLADWFIKPPVQGFKMLDFTNFDEIAELGYDYTDQLMRQSPGISEQFG